MTGFLMRTTPKMDPTEIRMTSPPPFVLEEEETVESKPLPKAKGKTRLEWGLQDEHFDPVTSYLGDPSVDKETVTVVLTDANSRPPPARPAGLDSDVLGGVALNGTQGQFKTDRGHGAKSYRNKFASTSLVNFCRKNNLFIATSIFNRQSVEIMTHTVPGHRCEVAIDHVLIGASSIPVGDNENGPNILVSNQWDEPQDVDSEEECLAGTQRQQAALQACQLLSQQEHGGEEEDGDDAKSDDANSDSYSIGDINDLDDLLGDDTCPNTDILKPPTPIEQPFEGIEDDFFGLTSPLEVGLPEQPTPIASDIISPGVEENAVPVAERARRSSSPRTKARQNLVSRVLDCRTDLHCRCAASKKLLNSDYTGSFHRPVKMLLKLPTKRIVDEAVEDPDYPTPESVDSTESETEQLQNPRSKASSSGVNRQQAQQTQAQTETLQESVEQPREHTPLVETVEETLVEEGSVNQKQPQEEEQPAPEEPDQEDEEDDDNEAYAGSVGSMPVTPEAVSAADSDDDLERERENDPLRRESSVEPQFTPKSTIDSQAAYGSLRGESKQSVASPNKSVLDTIKEAALSLQNQFQPKEEAKQEEEVGVDFRPPHISPVPDFVSPGVVETAMPSIGVTFTGRKSLVQPPSGVPSSEFLSRASVGCQAGGSSSSSRGKSRSPSKTNGDSTPRGRTSTGAANRTPVKSAPGNKAGSRGRTSSVPKPKGSSTKGKSSSSKVVAKSKAGSKGKAAPVGKHHGKRKMLVSPPMSSISRALKRSTQAKKAAKTAARGAGEAQKRGTALRPPSPKAKTTAMESRGRSSEPPNRARGTSVGRQTGSRTSRAPSVSRPARAQSAERARLPSHRSRAPSAERRSTRNSPIVTRSKSRNPPKRDVGKGIDALNLLLSQRRNDTNGSAFDNTEVYRGVLEMMASENQTGGIFG